MEVVVTRSKRGVLGGGGGGRSMPRSLLTNQSYSATIAIIIVIALLSINMFMIVLGR